MKNPEETNSTLFTNRFDNRELADKFYKDIVNQLTKRQNPIKIYLRKYKAIGDRHSTMIELWYEIVIEEIDSHGRDYHERYFQTIQPILDRANKDAQSQDDKAQYNLASSTNIIPVDPINNQDYINTVQNNSIQYTGKNTTKTPWGQTVSSMLMKPSFGTLLPFIGIFGVALIAMILFLGGMRPSSNSSGSGALNQTEQNK
jgi:RNAse (barnase) inhibitor barstar